VTVHKRDEDRLFDGCGSQFIAGRGARRRCEARNAMPAQKPCFEAVTLAGQRNKRKETGRPRSSVR